MKLEQLLDLINSSQTINVQWEDKKVYGDDIYYSDVICRIDTTMYGKTTKKVEENILSSKVKCIFPINNELWVYLEI